MRGARQLLAIAVLLAAAPAQAAEKPISGKLASNGYTVIALAYDGGAASARIARGRFSVAPTARVVTLSLRDRAGEYVGPVVVGRKGRRAVLGVRAGARLGKVRLARGVGRAKLRRSRTDRSRTAVTRKGRPIGAGRFGLVRARAVGAPGAGGDLDLDGVANAFDIDDDGDLVLDNNDRSSGTRVRQTGPPPPPGEGSPPPGEGPPPPPAQSGLRLFSNFHFNVDETLNANAGGVTRAQIDAAMTRPGSFVGLVFFLPDGVTEAELDCGGLTYCSPGGTGRASEPYPDGSPFPACCDADGDGLGTITRGPTGDFQLRTFAPSDAIGSGDTFVQILPDGTQITGSLNYMFNTTPAVKTHTDGSGATGTVSYPAGTSSPGTQANPLPVRPDAAGNHTLTLEFWRPQRDALPEAGEPEGFVDIGGLSYQVVIPNPPMRPGSPGTPGGGRGPGSCRLDALSSGDPALQATLPPFSRIDSAADAPADPNNTLTLTIDFTKCLAQTGQTLAPGDQLTWELQANSSVVDVAAQGWAICVPPAGQSACQRPQPQGPPQQQQPPQPPPA